MMIKVSLLKPHPKNEFFFDDMEGQKWVEFLESIKTGGIEQPIVVTSDYVIVSGHQRVRACKVLGIETIEARVKEYEDDDAILKALIETNVRQRADIGGSTLKLGRIAKELERLNGVSHGGDRKSDVIKRNNVPLYNQKMIAENLGIDERTLRNAKKLTELPKEIQQLVEDGNITASTASRLISRLSDEDKRKLVNSLDTDKRYTQKDIQGYVDRIKELENRKPEIKEVEPADYREVKAELKKLQDEKNAPTAERIEQINKSALIFNAGIANFIEKYGGYVWLTGELDILEDRNKKGMVSGINALKAWVYQMEQNLGGIDV